MVKKAETDAAAVAGATVEEVKEAGALKGEGYTVSDKKWHGVHPIYECNDCPYSSPSQAKVIRHRVDRHSPSTAAPQGIILP